MIAITVSITNVEVLDKLIEAIASVSTKEVLMKLLLNEVYEVMIEWKRNEIDADESIPEKYKRNVIVVKGDEAVHVLCYVPEVFEKKVESRAFATRAEWEVYRCVKRGYYYGRIVSVVEHPEEVTNILKDKWEKTKDKYTALIKNRIVEALRVRWKM